MGHALHVPLVHLHDDVALLQAAAPRIVHDLLDPLAAAPGAVGDGEAEALLAFLHVDGDQLGLRGDGRRQGDHVAGVAVLQGGVGRRLQGGAAGPREPVEGRAPVAGAVVVVLAAVAGGRVVAAGGLLAVDDDGVLVLQDGHRGHHAGVGVVGVEGQGVAAAQLQVDHGADGNRLEDLHNLGVSVTEDARVVDAHDHVTLGGGGGRGGTEALCCYFSDRKSLVKAAYSQSTRQSVVHSSPSSSPTCLHLAIQSSRSVEDQALDLQELVGLVSPDDREAEPAAALFQLGVDKGSLQL